MPFLDDVAVRGGRYRRRVDSITSQLLELVDAAELAAFGGGAGMPGVHADAARADARPSVAQALRHAEPGQVIAAQHRGRPVALAVLGDGRAFAVADRCPHDGGLLSDGFVEGDKLVCARHGWEVDPCTGRCPQRPREQVAVRELTRR